MAYDTNGSFAQVEELRSGSNVSPYIPRVDEKLGTTYQDKVCALTNTYLL